DITHRKRIEEELRASEQRWRLFFEQSPLSVQVFSPSGETLRVNAAWTRLFNLSEEEARAVNILEEPQMLQTGAVHQIRHAFAGEVVRVPPVPYQVRPAAAQTQGATRR